MQTVSKRLAVLYLHRRAWSSRTISLGPTRRHCPPPACCSEWQCRCPCSSCTCKTNSHPRLRGVSSANRKVIMKYLRKLTLFCYFICYLHDRGWQQRNSNHCDVNLSVYHDQDSMSERTSGLKSLLVIFVLIFPLHALLYDWTGFWGFIIPVQKEQSRCHVLNSCRRGNKLCFYFNFNTRKQYSAAGTQSAQMSQT